MDQVTIWVIAGVLLALIIGVLLFQIISERIKRKKIKKEKAELNKIEQEVIEASVYKVNAIMEINDDFLKKFVVSVGDKKMKDIRSFAEKQLKEITHEKKYKKIFIHNKLERGTTIHQNILNLIENKSNLWSKKNQEEIKYFKDMEKIFLEKNSEEYLSKKEQFKQEVLSNV
ncbi:MHJ_0274 family protein [Mycoplasma sp. 5370]